MSVWCVGIKSVKIRCQGHIERREWYRETMNRFILIRIYTRENIVFLYFVTRWTEMG